MFKKLNKKGFTLAELLVVVAIIGVLVAISIPIFTSQLEKSREAVDEANIRSAYAVITADAMAPNSSITDNSTDKITYTAASGNTAASAYVTATQQKDGWQGQSKDTDSVKIAGADVAPSTIGWNITVDANTGKATITAGTKTGA